LVYIFTLDAKSPSAQKLAAKFPSPYFHTQFAEVENPDNSTSWTPERLEAFRFKSVLTAAADEPTLPVLIVKDNATTTWSGSDIQQVISSIAARQGWSYANLASYNNACNDLTNPQSIANGAQTYDVPSTSGNAALLFSPATRDILIGKTMGTNGKPIIADLRSLNNALPTLMRQGLIAKPIIIKPNVFEYDVTKAGKAGNANYCAGDGSMGGGGWGIGLLFLFLLLLVLAFLFLKKR
jgi:hypothetical protein